jgi:hypothetical protein
MDFFYLDIKDDKTLGYSIYCRNPDQWDISEDTGNK